MVANRLPLTVSRRKEGLRFQDSAGGLATGLASFHRARRGLWLGWPGIGAEKLSADERSQVAQRLAAAGCHPVFLAQQDVDDYYLGFANKTIWPLCHYFIEFAVYSSDYWAAYQRVNAQFCDAVASVATPGDTVWVHDYQLMLLPALLRERRPDLRIGFFLHIPFPAFDVFRLLPWRREIMRGLLGADLIGFHTPDYARHFLDTAKRLLGHGHRLGRLAIDGRSVQVGGYPMGIDYARYAASGERADVAAELQKIRAHLGQRRVILSVDRLDYTKGIPQRLEAYDLFLKRYPQYREQVTLVLVAVPSRTEVDSYRRLKRRVSEEISEINGRHGTLGWTPVHCFYRSLPFPALTALYLASDVALVTPLRDGMNLVAKEYVATRQDGHGVLVLSEMAGAAQEMTGAIQVNPNHTAEMAEALKQALDMPAEEQMARNRTMQERLRRANVERWAQDFLAALDRTRRARAALPRQLTPPRRQNLWWDYRRGTRRLLLLDYDGTLVPFSPRPEQAAPDAPLLELLQDLAGAEGNRVVIVSGRDRQTLEQWLGHLDLALAAEHGAWTRLPGAEWRALGHLRRDWQAAVRPLLDRWAANTPGALVEEKAFSLAWHYRQAEPEQAQRQVAALKRELDPLADRLQLSVLYGNKVVEIKDSRVDKGQVAAHWLRQDAWDFILAAGDDATDEDLFAALPAAAPCYTIKVGLQPTRARYGLSGPGAVRKLLAELAAAPAAAPAPATDPVN